MESVKRLNGLATAIKENNLVLFVGAGLSSGFEGKKGPLGTWKNLVKQMIENDENLACLKPLVAEYEPIDLLDLIEKKGDKTKHKAIEFTKDFFHLPADKNDYNLHKKLCRLSHKIITTNYDNAFERADEDFTTKTAAIGKNYELSGLHKASEKTLLKLHGCITDGDTMVLFPSSYTNLYNSNNEDAERILFYLQSLIVNKTILFIGCGMGDVQIKNIFSKVRHLLGKHTTQTHYILAKETKLDSKLDVENREKEGGFLELISIKDYSEIESIIDELLKIKEEKDENKMDYEKQLKKLQEKLENTTDTMKTSSIKYEIKGIEFCQLGKYDRGLEFFEIATEFDTENDSVFYNWGTALGSLANTKKGKEAEDLFNQAFEKYQKAVEIKPDYHEAFYNWGNFLGNLANTKEGQEAEDLCKLAFEKYRKAVEIKPDYHEAFNNWGNDLGKLANTKGGAEAKDLFKQALDKYQKAVEIKPDKHEAFCNWGTYLGTLANTKTGQEAEDLYQLAFDKYQKAVEIKPDYHEAFNNWGTDLGNLAKTKDGQEAEDLFHQATDKYQKAVEIKPDFYVAFNNWGAYLGNLAKTKDGQEAEDLYQLAFDKYQKAVEIKPDYHEAFYNWGVALGILANTKEGQEAEDLFKKAIEKYQKAAEIKPDFYEAFNNWGAYLGNLAKTKDGQEAEDLYQLAFDKYQKAVEIKPDFYEAFNNWGTGLINLAKTKKGKEAEDLYQLAFEKCRKTVDLGGHSYNLACCHALRGTKEEALKYLTQCLERKEISPDFVLEDEDWKAYWSDKDFTDLIHRFK